MPDGKLTKHDEGKMVRQLKIEGDNHWGEGFQAEISEILDKIEANEKLTQIERVREDIGIDKVNRACCSFYCKAREDLLKSCIGKSKREVVIY